MENSIKIEIAQGYVDQRDLIYESHHRGTNWIATVSFDPSKPGSMERNFWEKGSGSFKKLPDELALGDFIEIAADYTSGGGNRSRKREYYRAAVITEDELILVADSQPRKKSLSKEDFLKSIAGENIEPDIDLSGVSTNQLIAELKKRNAL